MEEKSIVKKEERIEEENRRLPKRRQISTRLYGICCKTGYNVKIYPDVRAINSLSNFK